MNAETLLEHIRQQRTDKVFKELYRYWPRARRTLIQMGGTREEAEDIFQEALIIFYKKVSEKDFELRGAPEHYLLGCCKFAWLKLKNRELPTTVVDEMLIPAAELNNHLEEETRLNRASEALKQLGERCREILLSFYVMQLSMGAIAQKFGFTGETSAKTQKYKCLEHARDLYRITNPKA